jgi:hypothetical protein
MNSQILTASLLSLLSLLAGCSSTKPNRVPVGEGFPVVKGKSLSGESTELPTALAGKPAVLLVGYVQGTQFDLDRWVMGLMQAKTPVRILEVPTIDSLVPSVISGWIDSGMRSGIPSEDWPAVVTVYGSEAGKITAFTGEQSPRNTRVLLLDAQGKVVWFHDRGYSPAKAIELDAAARGL